MILCCVNSIPRTHASFIFSMKHRICSPAPPDLLRSRNSIPSMVAGHNLEGEVRWWRQRGVGRKLLELIPWESHSQCIGYFNFNGSRAPPLKGANLPVGPDVEVIKSSSPSLHHYVVKHITPLTPPAIILLQVTFRLELSSSITFVRSSHFNSFCSFPL